MKSELLKVRLQGGLANVQKTWIPSRGGYHQCLFLFLCLPCQSLGSVLSSNGGAT